MMATATEPLMHRYGRREGARKCADSTEWTMEWKEEHGMDEWNGMDWNGMN